MPITILLFVFIVGAEYLGLGNYIPLYKKLPIPLLISFALFLHVLNKNSVSEVLEHKQVKYYLFFIMLTASAMVHGLIHSYAIEPVKTQIGYFMLTVIAFFLIDNQKKAVLYASVFAIAHVLIIFANLDKFGQARTGYFKASFFLGDGNDFAWSLNIALPLAMFLIFSFKKPLYKAIFTATALFLLLGIVGTQSRGAFLALAAGFLYYLFFITEKKSSGIMLVLVVAISVVVFAPSNYFSRMETISSYEQDSSAMGRIKAWRSATEMAIDNPVLGVGAGSFNSAYGRFYRRPGDPVRWISTHSVFFKILGEYGFLGLFVYLMVIYHNFKTNFRTIQLIKENVNKVDLDILWPKCVNWSLVCCSVGSMFLSGVSYPHLFLLTGLTISASRIVTSQINNYSGDDDADANANKSTRWYDMQEKEFNPLSNVKEWK